MSGLAVKSVLIADPVHGSCAALLAAHGLRTDTSTGLTRQELLQQIQGYDGLIVRSETKVDAEVLRAGGGRLKVVGRAGTGVDNVDTAAATRQGVLVLNTPGGNSISACELTCSLILALARNVASACGALKEGRWERKKWAGREVAGKTLAVIGLGRIGREVARRMAGFGMTLVGHDPYPPAEDLLPPGLALLPLDRIWPLADYITLHVPLLPQTRGLIGKKELEACKEGACVVNCSRGGIVDEGALLEAVRGRRGLRAALDVFTEEPPVSPDLLALVRHPAVLVTPHLGASTAEAQERVAVEVAEQILALSDPSSGYSVEGAVNCPGLGELVREPGLEMLGRWLGALGRASLGEAAAGAGPLLLEGPPSLRGPVLLGLLPPDDALNLVNAPSRAADAGVDLRLASAPPPHASLSLGGERVFRGTVEGGEAFLLSVDGVEFSSPPRLTPTTLFFRTEEPHEDCDAFIGELRRRGARGSPAGTARGRHSSWTAVQCEDLGPAASLDLPAHVVALPPLARPL